MEIISEGNKKTRFTRMCIAEAIIDLLRDTEYEKLRVTNIVKRAGVARMTFYKYYTLPYEALTDYLGIIIDEYLEKSQKDQIEHIYRKYEHVLYSLNFFDQYADFFLILSKNNLYSIMMDGVNGFMENHLHPSTPLSIYDLYFYAGGLLNAFLKWEESGKKDSAEEVAQTITKAG